jgi:1-phosphofructokinase
VIVCTLLHPALDVVYDLAELRVGSTITDASSKMYPAGKGLNIAKVIKTLGEEVCVLGVVGAENERQFKDHLDAIGIPHTLLVTDGGVRINTTILESQNGQVTHVNSLGPVLPPRVFDEVLAHVKSTLSAGDLCAFSGSLPRGFEPDAYQKLVKVCREKKAAALLDSRGEALKRGVRAKPRMMKPNLTELEQFFGEQVQGVHHIALKGKRLVDMGIEYVFISLGSDGIIAIHENDCLLCSAPTVKTVDTVGCGDALAAGIMVGMVRKFSFSELCRMAVACGSSKAMHQGPGIVTRNEGWQLMEEVKVKAI